ncbi:MAG: murein transglycosylase A [Terricaulis silvestris]
MRRAAVLVLGLCVGACATKEATHPPGPTTPTTPTPPAFALQAAQFSDLPGWAQADLTPALTAFKRSCATRSLRAATAPMANTGRYGGTVADWQPACAAAQIVAPGGERVFFESYFTPARVSGGGDVRLTAYYEPIIKVSRTSGPGFTEPLLSKPNDMVTVDVAGFAEAYDSDVLRGAPRRLTGQINGAVVEPYPKRADIVAQPGQAFAYAHPADVYNLQVQGSGRISFPDGTQERASYAAQNGYRWSSAIAPLRNSGQLPGGATWPNFKAWIDAHTPDETRAVLNVDPSYVFFQEELIQDPTLGPRGAEGSNLTAMGSLAIDPDFHPYGALIYVDGTYNNAPFDHLLVAQDTGGAIRNGPLRGDVFFGSGDDAGAAAETMNGPAQWWTLLPKGAPIS